MQGNSTHLIVRHNGGITISIVAGNDKHEALERYVQSEFGYSRGTDGIYRQDRVTYSSMQDVFDVHGVYELENGRYANRDGRTFNNLPELVMEYGIEWSTDGHVICTGKSYSNILDLLSQESLPASVIEVQSIPDSIGIDPVTLIEAPPYLETNVSDTQLAVQHLWQSKRYEVRNKLEEAIRELESALKLGISSLYRVSLSYDLARLCSLISRADLAIDLYMDILKVATPFDDVSNVRYLLAKAYDEIGDTINALSNYNKAIELDPEISQYEFIARRISALQTPR